MRVLPFLFVVGLLAGCDPAPCESGCLNAAGRCEEGNRALACGASGLSCSACGFGQQCVLGACIGFSAGSGSQGGGTGGGAVPSGGGGGGSGSATPCAADVIIHTPGDWSNFVSSGCSTISGTLTIDVPGVAELTPPARELTSVADLRVALTSLTRLSLPSLATVSRDLVVAQNAALTDLTLPALRSVGNSMGVTECASLTTISMPTLSTVRHLYVRDNLALSSVSAPVLTTLISTLTVNHNPSLAQLTLPALQTLDGDLTVDKNDLLTGLSLPAMTRVGDLGLHQNPRLTRFSAPVLRTITESLVIYQNTALTHLELPALRAIAGSMYVEYNTPLRQCVVDAIKRGLTQQPTNYAASFNDGTPNTCN